MDGEQISKRFGINRRADCHPNLHAELQWYRRIGVGFGDGDGGRGGSHGEFRRQPRQCGRRRQCHADLERDQCYILYGFRRLDRQQVRQWFVNDGGADGRDDLHAGLLRLRRHDVAGRDGGYQSAYTDSEPHCKPHDGKHWRQLDADVEFDQCHVVRGVRRVDRK